MQGLAFEFRSLCRELEIEDVGPALREDADTDGIGTESLVALRAGIEDLLLLVTFDVS